MRFEDEDIEQMETVNTIMRKIHNHVDNIYESLMDQEHEELVAHLQGLTNLLRKMHKKYKP